MKKTILAASAALLPLLVPAWAQAQSTEVTGVYATVGYARASTGFATTFSGSPVGGDLKFGSVQGRLGYRFLPYLAVEGEAGYGLNSDDFTAFGQSIKVKQREEGAVYAVGLLPVSTNLDLFVRGGYGGTRVRAKGAGLSFGAGGYSWNYGAGAQLFFDGVNGVRAEYTRKNYKNDEAKDADTWSIAYVRRF